MLPGTLLDGRYRVLRKHGSGGEGEIFVARDELHHQNVVIKAQFPRSFESTSAYLSAAIPLRDEFDRLTFMQNVSGIPKVLGTGRYGRYEGYYIAMEFIEGDTVASWIAHHHPVPAAAAISVVAQLSEILTGVHAAGYVHRDVCTRNTMLQPDGRARLLDVGISGVAGETTDDTRGTVGYAPPEQYDPTVELTPQVDVFSLGAMFFAMVGSELPYSGLEGPPDATTPAFPHGLHADVPEVVGSLALAMVSVDPRERPSLAEVLDYLRPMLPTPGSGVSPKATRPDPTAPYCLGLSLP